VVTGGAILGDRIRMGAHAGDPAIFVRSIAARGQLGGLARMTAGIVDLMDAAGKDVVIVETVGAGQSEIEVAGLAQCCVVVLPPGLGDDVQAIKAGILEIADVLVVTKCDLPGADLTARQLNDRARMNKRGTKVLRVTAPRGEGIAALVDAFTAHAAQAGRTHVAARTRRMLIELALAEARARLERDADGALAGLSAAVQDGSLRLRDAAETALGFVSSPLRPDPHPSPLPQAGEGADPAPSGTLSRLRERVG
jgi:LAO/AO transport system kinase